MYGTDSDGQIFTYTSALRKRAERDEKSISIKCGSSLLGDTMEILAIARNSKRTYVSHCIKYFRSSLKYENGEYIQETDYDFYYTTDPYISLSHDTRGNITATFNGDISELNDFVLYVKKLGDV